MLRIAYKRLGAHLLQHETYEIDPCEETYSSCCLLSQDIKAKQEPRSWTAEGVWQHSLKNLATLIQVLASLVNFIQRP